MCYNYFISNKQLAIERNQGDDNMGKLDHKVALVTAATMGIGLGMC